MARSSARGEEAGARDRIHPRSTNRVPHYRELIQLTRATLAYADQAAAQLSQAPDPVMAAPWQAEFRHYRPLIERIIRQTERGVSTRSSNLHARRVTCSRRQQGSPDDLLKIAR